MKKIFTLIASLSFGLGYGQSSIQMMNVDNGNAVVPNGGVLYVAAAPSATEMCIRDSACTSYEYIFGIQAFFEPWKLSYSFTKVLVFAFIITSVASYFGYYTQGGALEVGKSSTDAVVYSSILILIFNFLLTQIFLT